VDNENRLGATRSPSLAVFLSFVWPGWGQWYQGRRRTAALYALPVLAVTILLAVQLIGGIEKFAAGLLDPTVAQTLVILVALLGIWRIFSMADALIAGTGHGIGRAAAGSVFGVLTLIVIGAHAWVGSVTWAFYDAGSQIFVGDRGPDATPITPTASGSDAPDDNINDFQATPIPTPESASKRISILLTGVDSGHGREHALTDTIMLISVDPDTGKVAMLSFPRDISNFPLYSGGTYKGKINSLMTYARLHPEQFPDGGLPTLVKEVGFLAGIPVQYFAAINLEGFQKMIDLVGGVDVVNPRAINDPRYDWFDGTHGFTLKAGPVHLDGRIGLAYVRSRQGVGDSDFTRAARQQQVLGALRKKVTNPSVIAKLPDLLHAIGSSVRTNYPVDSVRDLVDLASKVSDNGTFKKVLGPPYAVHPPNNTTGGVYTLQLDMDRIAKLSVDLFGADSRYAESASGGQGASAAP
jgi:polyisoprenyl-teichoic acid--peptidoglycan teichoic acid transferase